MSFFVCVFYFEKKMEEIPLLLLDYWRVFDVFFSLRHGDEWRPFEIWSLYIDIEIIES